MCRSGLQCDRSQRPNRRLSLSLEFGQYLSLEHIQHIQDLAAGEVRVLVLDAEGQFGQIHEAGTYRNDPGY